MLQQKMLAIMLLHNATATTVNASLNKSIKKQLITVLI